MVELGSLHHVEINVSNISKSSDFWDWFLTRMGYSLYQIWDEGRSWKKADTYIVLVQTAEKYLNIPYHRSGTGLNHLAFHAKDNDEVDGLIEELKLRGIKRLYADKYPQPDYYAVYFEDPDRIKIEFVSRSRVND